MSYTGFDSGGGSEDDPTAGLSRTKSYDDKIANSFGYDTPYDLIEYVHRNIPGGIQ